MRIIISPAKKMRVDTDHLLWQDLPCFLPDTEKLYHTLKDMDYPSLKALWKCSDQIAAQNARRIADMDLRQGLTPAILAYEGIQYQYMAPNVFTQQEFDYIQEHLRILSGFYGILKPFDGVTPYRLEMQAKLNVCNVKDLYGFWNSKIAEKLFSESSCIVNLASKEYSTVVSKYLNDGIHMVNCIFAEEKQGRVVEKGTLCKMARGEMVRYMAERQIVKPEDIRSFARLDFTYDPARSDENTYVFLRREKSLCR